jgi:ABC-type multidrug transport system fused ATPase/permease subunit
MLLSSKPHWILLRTYLGPQRRRAALLAVLLFCSIGLQLLNPQVIRYFIDTAEAGGAESLLLLAAVAFIIAGLVQRAIAFASLYVSENMGWTATNALRADLARHCLRLDMAFHKSHTPGELIERIDGDVATLDDFLSQFSIQLIGNAILILAILALLFRENWRLGLGLVLYTVIAFAALSSVQRLGTRRWAAERQADSELYGFLEERMSGTEDIRASGAEAHTLARLDRLMDTMLKKNRAAKLVSNLTFVLTNFLFVIGYALGLALGAYLYGQGQVSIGTAFLIVYYIGMLSWPLENIREQAQNFQQASAGVKRIDDLLALRPRVTEAVRGTLPDGALEVAFHGVSFEYDDGDQGLRNGDQESFSESPIPSPQAPVLSDISFRLAPGTKLGVLGRTGSGKTTLTRLLFRLYDPIAGAIQLGGIDLRDLALADLRGRVGMVTQEVQLFQASIRDNLALFDSSVDDRQIERALEELELLDWVRALPEGLDTKLGAGGLGLSAGETQLLAFARVFLHDPGLVILDEASSRLDPATERLLTRAVDRLIQGRTAIVVAHRLGTVQRADAIMILDQGTIAEYGPRNQLAGDQGSRFYQLLQTGLEEVLA